LFSNFARLSYGIMEKQEIKTKGEIKAKISARFYRQNNFRKCVKPNQIDP